MKVDVEIAIECERWEAAAPDLEALAKRVVNVCFEEMRLDPQAGTEVSLLFCDDHEIRTLNLVWRKQDRPTNVLSFPAAASASRAPVRTLGDIALAYETVEREARTEGKAFEDHATHLIAHGLLHLLGYDHETDADAEKMEAQERAILARLGVADPYGARDCEAP